MARAERLASLSLVQRQIEEALDNRQDQNMPETTAIYQAIERGRWSGDEKLEAAQWLERRMKAGGRGNPPPRHGDRRGPGNIEGPFRSCAGWMGDEFGRVPIVHPARQDA